MFDMNVVSRNLKEARTRKNMTQMDLADELGVSYQAVSNWERGNSMPDISKIPDISRILEVSFEELVGEDTNATKAASRLLENENAQVSMEELAEVAPILKPDQVTRVVRDNMEQKASFDIRQLVSLAPYLSREELDAMAEKIEDQDISSLVSLAPFLSRSTLDRMVVRYIDKDTKPTRLVSLAPFLSQDTLQKIVKYISETGNLKYLTSFAPFLGKGVLVSILEGKDSWPQSKEEAEEDLLSQLDEDEVAELARKAVDEGRDVEAYLEYMDEDDVKELLLYSLKQKK